ncbi:hypothetical protein cypCar_00033177 [Cyprinus carpio]|nr:hypothetical protein cypCar_00033177 [Cyprinus carpio]
MRLYTLSKRHFVLVFVVFFFCFGVSTLIGVSGPKIISENYYNGLSVSTNGSKTGPFDLRSQPLSNYNQQLWLTCIIQLDSNIADLSLREFGMNVELQGVMQDASVTRISNNIHNKNRSLHCAAACDEIIVLHLGYLNYTQYKISVSFRNLLQDRIKNVTFVFKMYNATFSQVEIWFRFVFVVMTFIVTCVFAHSLRRFSMRDWGVEQKWMSVLLPLLLLYNGTAPDGPRWSPPSAGSTHLCSHPQGERRFLSFYLPKLLIVGLLWLSAVTLGIWQTPASEVPDGADAAGAADQLKDNPAFSMLNDSDDEVIYGSDYEEMPLQNGRAIKASAKHPDESESD